MNFNKIEGTRTITNSGRNSKGNLTFSVTVNGTVSIDPQYSSSGNGGTMTYSATKTKEWIQGESTLRWDDDIYLVSGTASGTNTANVTYTATADPNAPLRREIGFPHFTSGILSITQNSNDSPVIIDYSYLNGQRDDLARVTIDGNTYTIHLGMKH